MLKAYLLFYQFSLKVFINFNLLLQREYPLISRVHGHIQRFLKKLVLSILNLDVIDVNDNPAQIDFEDINNQKKALMLKSVFHVDQSQDFYILSIWLDKRYVWLDKWFL